MCDPVYDEDAATLTYEAKVLADYAGRGLQHLAQQQTDDELPASFGEGSLFIDDCADTIESCWLMYDNPDGSVCTREDEGWCHDDISLWGTPGCCGAQGGCAC